MLINNMLQGDEFYTESTTYFLNQRIFKVVEFKINSQANSIPYFNILTFLKYVPYINKNFSGNEWFNLEFYVDKARTTRIRYKKGLKHTRL